LKFHILSYTLQIHIIFIIFHKLAMNFCHQHIFAFKN
jgi:hypothetical protein